MRFFSVFNGRHFFFFLFLLHCNIYLFNSIGLLFQLFAHIQDEQQKQNYANNTSCTHIWRFNNIAVLLLLFFFLSPKTNIVMIAQAFGRNEILCTSFRSHIQLASFFFSLCLSLCFYIFFECLLTIFHYAVCAFLFEYMSVVREPEPAYMHALTATI